MKGLNAQHVFLAQMANLRCSGKQFCVPNKHKVFLPSAYSKTLHSMKLISSSKNNVSYPFKIRFIKTRGTIAITAKMFQRALG